MRITCVAKELSKAKVSYLSIKIATLVAIFIKYLEIRNLIHPTKYQLIR